MLEKICKSKVNNKHPLEISGNDFHIYAVHLYSATLSGRTYVSIRASVNTTYNSWCGPVFHASSTDRDLEDNYHPSDRSCRKSDDYYVECYTDEC